MKFIALVPARSGSKRLAGKNLRTICGRSLVQIACEEANRADAIDGVFVSTDSKEIRDEALRFGALAPYLRAYENATDEAPMFAVVKEFLGWLDEEGITVGAIVLLQPTSPLRLAQHIDEACNKYISGNFDTVVSVLRAPHQFHPRKIMKLNDGNLFPYLEAGPSIGKTGDLDEAYARNGPSVLISSVDNIRSGRMYGERIGAYEMLPEFSVDIDTQSDFELAEFYMQRRNNKNPQ